MKRREERPLDLGMFHDILGKFSGEPAGEQAYVLTPLKEPCIALHGREISQGEERFVLDIGNVEADGVTTYECEAENIGLDAVSLSAGQTDGCVLADFVSKTVRLEPGQSAVLNVGILGPGEPRIVFEGGFHLLVSRGGVDFELPVTVKATSAKIGAAPRFTHKGGPCPAVFDFGRVEARDLIDIVRWEQETPLIFRCRIENLGQKPCLFLASIEGEGFELSQPAQGEDFRIEIQSEEEIEVAVKPSFSPLGQRWALLRMVAEGASSGSVVVSVRMSADVFSSKPLFSIEPRTETIVSLAGSRCMIPILATNMGYEPATVSVLPILGERMLPGTEIELPPASGIKPSLTETSIIMESSNIPPGRYTVELAAAMGSDQLFPAGSLMVHIEDVSIDPAELNFGPVPIGNEVEKEVNVNIPQSMEAHVEILGDLDSVLSVNSRGPGCFTVRVNNSAEYPDDPRHHDGMGLRVSIPAIGFAREVQVYFRRLRPRLSAPAEVDFGSADVGKAIDITVPLVNEGDDELIIRASSTAKSIGLPEPKLVIPAGSEKDLLVNLRLPDTGARPGSEGVPFTATIVLAIELPPKSRKIVIKGRVMNPAWIVCSNPSCGAVNKRGSDKCELCEGAMSQAAFARAENIRQCPSCKGLFLNDYSFCPKDGERLASFSEGR